MKVGDLVMIKQGPRQGKLALVTKVGPHPQGIIHVIRECGYRFGYYKRFLEVIA